VNVFIAQSRVTALQLLGGPTVLVAGAVVPAGADGATPGVAAGSDMAGGTGTDSGGMYSGPVCPQPASATLATIATAGNSLEL
jgi:hypothetical protein